MSSVDAIVPCYRYGCYLRECVASVLAQSIRDIRVLIINDGSPDNTAEVAADLLKEDSRVRYLEHATNKGHIYTYNEGIDWASADYLVLLSADDYLLPGALNRAISLMQRYPVVGFTFGSALEVDENGRRTLTGRMTCQNGERILAGPEFIALSGHRNIVPTPTAVVRTALQKAVGKYRTELPHTGDMEVWLRLAAYAAVGFVESPQAVYRRHGKNMSLSYSASRRFPDVVERKAALDCFFERCSNVVPDSTRLRRNLLRLFALEAVGLASEAFNYGELEITEKFLHFALHTSPTIDKSWAWAKLACKRRMGVKAWHALRPVISGSAKQRRRLG
jgi:hypothetical protein